MSVSCGTDLLFIAHIRDLFLGSEIKSNLATSILKNKFFDPENKNVKMGTNGLIITLTLVDFEMLMSIYNVLCVR